MTDIELCYKDHKRLVFKLSWTYSNKCSIDIKDMISEMNVVFCEAYKNFDPKKHNTFSIYLAICCNNRFKNLMTSMYRKKRQMIFYTDKEIYQLSNDPEESVILLDFFVNNPNEIVREISKIVSTYKLPPSGFKNWLKSHLRKQNFRWDDIAEAFKILKTIYDRG